MTAENVFTEFHIKTGVTQTHTANAIGVTPAAVANYASGLRVPKPVVAKRFVVFAQTYDVHYTLDDVYRDVEAAA